jgi:tetratricopeptide (TPR) repeat protein
VASSVRGRVEGAPIGGTLTAQKLAGWRDGLEMVGSYFWTGVGRGAFEGPATAFRDAAEHARLVFPENLPIQIASEWGVPVALGLVVLFVLAAVPVIRQIPRWEPSFQGAACGVLAVLVHELADFGLELPGVAFPTAMAVGLCAGRLQMSASKASETQRTLRWPVVAAAGAAWLAVLAAGPWAVARHHDAEAVQARELSGRPGPQAAATLAAMVSRHPSAHFFELCAARQAMLTRSPTALRHVNRALRLFPESPAPHLLAFHQLAAMGHREQAAMEYRLAVERGYNFNYGELVGKVGVANVIRAAPQRPDELLQLAGVLVSSGRPEQADALTARAVALAVGSPGEEAARIKRAEIAMAAALPAFMGKAGVELGTAAATTRGFEAAAEALMASGDLAQARQVLLQAVRHRSGDGTLPVRAARLLFNQGDLATARQLLIERTGDNLALADRIAAEELLAQISDKQGNREAAAAARARARMLGHLKE